MCWCAAAGCERLTVVYVPSFSPFRTVLWACHRAATVLSATATTTGAATTTTCDSLSALSPVNNTNKTTHSHKHTMDAREEYVYLAKLSEQAERYDGK